VEWEERVKDERIHELLIWYRRVIDEHNYVKVRDENGFCYW